MADIRINALATTATTPASDDYLALDGTAQGTRKILATNIANNVTDVILGSSGPSVKSTLSARAPRQGLVFDGTAGATVANVPAFGTGDFTFAAWVNQPTLAAAYLCSATGGADSAFLYLVGNGTFQWWSNTAARATSSAGAFVANKWTLLTATRTGGTTTLYANGVSVGSGADSQNLTSAIDRIGQRAGGTNILNGSLIPLIYNRALSASEVVALYEAGAPAGADYNSASNTAINTNTAVDGVAGNNTFAATAGGSFTGASATGFTAVSGGGAYAAASFQPNFTVQPGQIIRVTYTATVNSGTVLASLMNSSVSSISSSHTVTTGTRTVEFVATAASTSARVIFGSSGGSACNFSVSSVSVVRSGLLLAPDAAQAGGGLVWYDTSGNAANITLPASGVSWNVPTSGKTATGWSFNSPLLVGTTIDAGYTITARASDASIAAMSSDASSQIRLNAQSGIAILETVTNTPLRFRTNSTEAMRLFANGNVFVGASPVDSGNGKLQLATHTTSAGGIGFGTDTSLFRAASGNLCLNDSGTNAALSFYNAGTLRGYVFAQGSTTTFILGSLTAGWSTAIQSGNGTTALTLDSSQHFKLTPAVASSIITTQSAPQIRMGSRATGRSNVVLDSTAGRVWNFENTGTNLTIGYSGLDALTIAETTGDATFAGTVKSAVATGGRTLQATPSVTVAQDAVQNLVTQNYGFFLISEVSITGSIAIIGFNAGGTYLVWQEGTNYSTTINTASKFNVYYSSGNQLVVQNKKTGSASFNIINLAGGS